MCIALLLTSCCCVYKYCILMTLYAAFLLFAMLESILQQELKDQNMDTHFNGIHYGNCILYGDSIRIPLEMYVHVLILKVMLSNGF